MISQVNDLINAVSGELVLNEFTAIGHICYPTSYVLNPTSSSYAFKRDCSSDTPPLSVDCRTVVYSRLAAGDFKFNIDVTGPINTLTSPEININVKCGDISSPYGATLGAIN